MVFGFKKHQEIPEDVDPLEIAAFNDVKIRVDLTAFQKFMNMKSSGTPGFQYSTGRGASALVGGSGIISNMAGMNTRRTGGTSAGASGFSGQASQIFANKLVLRQVDIQAKNGNKIALHGMCDLEYLKKFITGADKRNKEILGIVPKPDLPSGLYSHKLMVEVYQMGDKIMGKGYVSEASVLVDIEVDKAGMLGGKKFVARIAHIDNSLEMNEKQEKKPSAKSAMKEIGKAYVGMFGIKKGTDSDDSEWFINPSSKLDPIAKVIRYDIEIEDKDNKKENFNVREIMEKFASDVQPKVKELSEYAFNKTEKEKELKLSEAFLKDFYA